MSSRSKRRSHRKAAASSSAAAASSSAATATTTSTAESSSDASPRTTISEPGVGYSVVIPDDCLPPIPAGADDTDDDVALHQEEREVLVLLLHARQLLGNMLLVKEEQNRKAWEERQAELRRLAKESGDMSVQEIQDILQNADFDEEGRDFVAEMQDLKRQLVIEIRKNHQLDRNVAKLDKKIALLIKNRGNVQSLVHKPASSSKQTRANRERVEISTRQLANYQDLFYLLQTQPRYFASLVYLVKPEDMEKFLDTTILTLYGDAFSPREEFLILKLFQLAIQREISVIKSVGDFLTAETVVPKMVITYNRRKAGFEYLKKMLRPPMESFLEQDIDYLELNPKAIYHAMINEAEIRTGKQSNLPRDVDNQQALENPDVKQIVDERTKVLQKICDSFLQAILKSQEGLPYGLRWICKQLRELIIKALPDATHDDILKLTGYFVYYRFINVAIIYPDGKTRDQQIVATEISATARRNLVVVSRVLQNLFNFRSFGDDQPGFQPLNEWIEKSKPVIADYFDALTKVPDPEDHLQVNTYMELTQKTKPVIQISLFEIFRTHSLLHQHLKQVAPDNDDPLRKIMQDLGDCPSQDIVGEENNREIQLTLTNRFKVDVEEDDPVEKMYAETKELLIPILRKVPIQESLQTLGLLDVLDSGIKHAQQTQNEELNAQINKILENINQLEKEEMLSKDDNYESFVHDVAREVANRNTIRAQQKKEIERLKLTLSKLRDHQSYLGEQIEQYEAYLDDCKKSFYAGKTKKKNRKKGSSGQKLGPYKFKYSELEKQGVIVDSEVPTISRKKTSFSIVSESPGNFKITAKLAGISVETMELELDDLLERHYNNLTRLELDQVTLDVNMTIHLLNKFFVKNK